MQAASAKIEEVKGKEKGKEETIEGKVDQIRKMLEEEDEEGRGKMFDLLEKSGFA